MWGPHKPIFEIKMAQHKTPYPENFDFTCPAMIFCFVTLYVRNGNTLYYIIYDTVYPHNTHNLNKDSSKTDFC